MLPDRNMSVMIGPSGGIGKRWTYPLYITARIEKTEGSKPDTASVVMHNLSQDSNAYIKRSNQMLQVRAGEDYQHLLFSGQITPRQVEVQLQGADTITEIKAGDGRLAYRDTMVGLSYPSGIDRETVIGDIVSAMGVPRGYVTALPRKTYTNGYAFAGRARHALDDVLDRDGVWRITNGVIDILRPGEAKPGGVVIIAARTGMIGSPRETDKGIDCEVLLTPALVPGAVYRIESKQVKGSYRATAVAINVTSDGSTWMQAVTGVPL